MFFIRATSKPFIWVAGVVSVVWLDWVVEVDGEIRLDRMVRMDGVDGEVRLDGVVGMDGVDRVVGWMGWSGG